MYISILKTIFARHVRSLHTNGTKHKPYTIFAGALTETQVNDVVCYANTLVESGLSVLVVADNEERSRYSNTNGVKVLYRSDESPVHAVTDPVDVVLFVDTRSRRIELGSLYANNPNVCVVKLGEVLVAEAPKPKETPQLDIDLLIKAATASITPQHLKFVYGTH